VTVALEQAAAALDHGGPETIAVRPVLILTGAMK
jgi:hypothetical protein